MYELDELSLKFERYLNCEGAPSRHLNLVVHVHGGRACSSPRALFLVVATHFLSQDYAKLAMLMADRYIELHAAYGFHFRVRQSLLLVRAVFSPPPYHLSTHLTMCLCPPPDTCSKMLPCSNIQREQLRFVCGWLKVSPAPEG